MLVGMQKGAATVENSLAVPQMVKHRVTMWLRNSTPRYIPKRNENITLHQNLIKNVHGRITHDIILNS